MTLFKNKSSIEVEEFDDLVRKTYGKIYNLQQQGEGQDRGTVNFQVPNSNAEDFKNESLVYDEYESGCGVSFKAWLQTDVAPGTQELEDWEVEMFWERNFFPHLEALTQDLYEKGLIPAGEHQIIIDW